jgi:spermidine synthase
MSNAAFVLATARSASLRDPAEAVALASEACRLSDQRNAFCLSSLAAAFAADGRFDQAVRTARQGIQVAQAAGQNALAATIQRQLAFYEAGKPLVDPPARRAPSAP